MTLNTDAIMQGKAEVSLGEAYTVLKNYGVDAHAIDSTYDKLDRIQKTALAVLGISLLFTVLSSAFLVSPAANVIAAKMGAALLGFGAAAGLVALAVCCAKQYHLHSTKLNAEQANQLLKNVKRAVEKQRADYLDSPYYKATREHKKHLQKLADKIEPNYRVQ